MGTGIIINTAIRKNEWLGLIQEIHFPQPTLY